MSTTVTYLVICRACTPKKVMPFASPLHSVAWKRKHTVMTGHELVEAVETIVTPSA